MGSKTKEGSSKLNDKHQVILADLLRNEDNKFCADCLVKGPRWASWNLGVFMCIRCAGIHRNLGVHISRVKSVNLDSWTPEQIESIQKGGNGRARDLYEANLPSNFRRPQNDYAVEQFIRAKYERKLYTVKIPNHPSAKPTRDTAPQESRKSSSKQALAKKEGSSNDPISRSSKIMAVPRPTSGRQSRSPSPQPMKTSPSLPSPPNLLNFDSVPSLSKSVTPTVDLLTGLTQSPPTSTSSRDLMDTSQIGQSGHRPSFVTDPGLIASQQPAPLGQSRHPPLVPDPALQTSSDRKSSIMSLYSTPQSQHASYTPQGYPVNAFYIHQQQQASMRMAQMAHQQQLQVNQVQQQMAKIKLDHPQQSAVSLSNGTAPPAMLGNGGQTLNPNLW